MKMITVDCFMHLLNYHDEEYNEDCCIVDIASEEKLKVVWLKSLKDFTFGNYDVKENIVVMFRDCGHVFTFGEADAYLSKKNTMSVFGDINTRFDDKEIARNFYKTHVKPTHDSTTEKNYIKDIECKSNADDIYSCTIAFGSGNSINEGLGYAITLGGGKAHALYRVIAIGENNGTLIDSLNIHVYNQCFRSRKLKNKGAYNYPIFDHDNRPYKKMFEISYSHGSFLLFSYDDDHHDPKCIPKVKWTCLVNDDIKTSNELIVNFINYPLPGEDKNE